MVDNTENQMSSETQYRDLNTDKPDFKSIRESRGLTLKDIYKSTRISITNLAAIENGDFHLLPAPVFTKSFIKIYAKTLGVDSTSKLARYEQYLDTKNTATKDVETKKSPPRARISYRRLLWWGSLILVAAVTATSFLFWHKSQIEVLRDKPVESTTTPPTTSTADDTTANMQKNIPDSTDTAKSIGENIGQSTTDTPVQQSAHETANKPDIQQKQSVVSREITEKYPLIMKASELTWLRIRADHNPPYEILLQPGEKIERSASKFLIDIGNAGGITIDFQGKSLGNLGKHGEVIHLTLP